MHKIRIAASIMCANLLNLADDIRVLERNGIDYLHVDIMDGHFVPNITLGYDLVNYIGQQMVLHRDIHLMVKRPEWALERLNVNVGDIVTIHAESHGDLGVVLNKVRAAGALPAIALCPESSISAIERYLPLIDHILIMTVRPGFSGGEYIVESHAKVSELRSLLSFSEYSHIGIGVDGGISCERIRHLHQHGADYFVLGTSALFKDDLDRQAKRVLSVVAEVENIESPKDKVYPLSKTGRGRGWNP